MSTPMWVWNEIAARYGADPYNEDSVAKFYQEQMSKLKEEEVEAILEELLDRCSETRPNPYLTKKNPK